MPISTFFGKFDNRKYVFILFIHRYYISEPDYVPEVTVRGIGPSFINIAWTMPPFELRSHVHYFKLLMFNNDVRKETVVNADSFNMYAFSNLESATTYNFQVHLYCLNQVI